MKQRSGFLECIFKITRYRLLSMVDKEWMIFGSNLGLIMMLIIKLV